MLYSKTSAFIFYFLLMFGGIISHAQTNRIDILRSIFEKAVSKEENKQVALNMCEQYYSLSPDSLLRYIIIGKRCAEPGSPEYTEFQNYYCTYLFKIGKISQGMALSDSLISLAKFNSAPDRVGMDIIAIRCSGFIRNGENKEAIRQSFMLLQAAEKLKDTLVVTKAYTLLGWANMELDQNNEAIKWMVKGVHYTSNPKIIEKEYNLFSNIAACYDNVNQEDSAFYYITLALRYSKSQDNLASFANALNIRASIYIKKNNDSAAEADMQEALSVRQRIGDMLYVTSDMAGLSYFYASTNQTEKGINIAKEGIAIAEKANNLSKLIFLYSSLGENYHKSNKLNEYNATLENIIRLKDSLYKKNSSDAIAEMEAKYNLQKQQNIIITQNYALTRSRYLSIGSSLLFLLGLLLIWVLYRNYRLSQKRKMEIAVAEQKMLSGKAVELARENERKRIAADLHDNLGSYAAAITANVKYLREKQGAEDDIIMAQLDTNAQSMVTQLSDTIWVLKNEHLPFTGLADRFKLWMLKLMQNYPHIKYHYNENIVNDIEFTPARILHIFLMLKECVNNAVKHSNCTELKIDFFSNNTWRICIEDNGRGFESTYISKGSGIDNIKNRASESGWVVEWEKVVPSGTRVVIMSMGD